MLHKKAIQYENELKELKVKIKALQDENIRQVKINEQEKKDTQKCIPKCIRLKNVYGF